MLWKYSALHPDTPNQLYALFGSAGGLTEAAVAALVGGFESDAFLAGNYQGFDWANRSAINYDNLTTFFRSDIDPNAKNVKTSPRTREIMLSLEKELGPDLGASAAATFRRYDNFDWEKPFYPADIYPSTPDLVIDNTATWFTVAGTIPQTITVGEDETIDLGDAGGRPWYLPVATFPGNTPYRMVDKSTAYRTYIGLDLAVTKRLSHHWFLNASLTLQDQRVHWGDSFIDPTNQWAVDGKPYGNLGQRRRRQDLRPDVLPLAGQAQRPLPAALGLRRFGHLARAGGLEDPELHHPGLRQQRIVAGPLSVQYRLPSEPGQGQPAGLQQPDLPHREEDLARHRPDGPHGRRLQRAEHGRGQPGLRRLPRDLLRGHRGVLGEPLQQALQRGPQPARLEVRRPLRVSRRRATRR